MIRAAFTFCLALACADAVAQPQPPGTPRPGPLPGARVTRPPRDPAQETSGTSAIRGRVTAAETGQPLRRVQVRAFGEFGDPIAGARIQALRYGRLQGETRLVAR